MKFAQMYTAMFLMIAACGHEGNQTTSSSALDDDEKPGEGEPVDCSVVDCWGGKEDPGTTAGAPLPSCAESGFACAVIVDKENLCPPDLSDRWDLACGDNEVCCGEALPVSDPGTEAPDDSKCTGT